jgi:hypothetical protein
VKVGKHSQLERAVLVGGYARFPCVWLEDSLSTIASGMYQSHRPESCIHIGRELTGGWGSHNMPEGRDEEN